MGSHERSQTRKSAETSLNDSDFKELKARLMVAFDIAHTVAYLHAAEILVKNLSDVDVVLIKEKERWKPILTNLERARFVGQPGSDPTRC